MAANDILEEMQKMNASFEMLFTDALVSLQKGNLPDSEMISLYNFIISLNFTDLTENDYYSIVSFLQEIYIHHFLVIKWKFDEFSNNFQTIPELFLILEYALATGDKEATELINKTILPLLDKIHLNICSDKNISINGLQIQTSNGIVKNDFKTRANI